MPRKLIVSLVLAGLAAALFFYFFDFGDVPKKGSVAVNNFSFDVEIADTLARREKGLSGRAELPEGEGMLFIFDTPGLYGFWMKDMQFPIDIIWIRGDRVVGFTENVPIPAGIFDLKTYYPPEPVDGVLEVGAGLVRDYSFKIGDPVMVK